MIGLGEIFSFISFMKDSSYDMAFAIGDTSLQLGAELIHGPQNTRYGQYAYRSIERQQKPLQIKTKSKPIQKKSKAQAEKPLRFEEKRSFAQMMRRQKGESIIEHWKRQKILLAAPNKQQLIVQHQALTEKLNAKELQQGAIQTEMKSISSSYQKTRIPKRQLNSKKRTRSR